MNGVVEVALLATPVLANNRRRAAEPNLRCLSQVILLYSMDLRPGCLLELS